MGPGMTGPGMTGYGGWPQPTPAGRDLPTDDVRQTRRQWRARRRNKRLKIDRHGGRTRQVE